MHALVAKLWRIHRPSVLLVTHDVDEALSLADRALVLAEGRIVAEVTIELPRPRDSTSRGFGDLHRRLLAFLGVDVLAILSEELAAEQLLDAHAL
jgi:sulfonate transport system ATP-binding protein